MSASITVTVEWCMGHRLPNHNGACKNLHGHQYKAEATVPGDISTVRGSAHEGMVMDFGLVKSVLKEVVKDLDHTFLLSVDDPHLPQLRGLPGVHSVLFVPTAENIAQFILEQLPEGVTSVRVWETPTSYAEVWR